MNELKPQRLECCIDKNALALKVQRYLMPNVGIDGTVSVEDAERWFLKLIEEQPAVDVSALLCEKDAEIERLRKAKYIYSTVDYCADDLAKAQEKIERLKADNKDLVDLCHLLNHSLEEERAIVIDEFVERVKEAVKYIPWCDYPPVHNCIDQIAKEMKEVER